jgi:hypothetical protein
MEDKMKNIADSERNIEIRFPDGTVQFVHAETLVLAARITLHYTSKNLPSYFSGVSLESIENYKNHVNSHLILVNELSNLFKKLN